MKKYLLLVCLLVCLGCRSKDSTGPDKIHLKINRADKSVLVEKPNSYVGIQSEKNDRRFRESYQIDGSLVLSVDFDFESGDLSVNRGIESKAVRLIVDFRE